MAISKLKQISQELAQGYPDLKGLAIYHKIGEVPVGLASVTIVAVSPHRKCAIEVAAVAIEQIKAQVPIWKKEFYNEPQLDAEWKANTEFTTLFSQQKISNK